MSGKGIMGIGAAFFLGGILWASLIPGGWADLWRVIKGGTGLFLLLAALITLAMGVVQIHEERENLRRQEEQGTV